MRRKVLRTGLALAGVAAATTLTWATGTTPAHAEPECLNQSNDFDRDRTVDVVGGMPGADGGAGAVEVRLSNDGEQKIVRLQAPDAAEGDAFGASVAEVASYRNEAEDARCTQLVVGAPGRDVGGKADAGAVFVYRYDLSSGSFQLVREFVQGQAGVPGSPQAGARLGATLAAEHHIDQIAPVVTRLYAGAPGATVGGQQGAGAFVTFRLDDGAAVDAERVAQGAGAPGTAEAGDEFGASLAAVSNGVLVGAPGENNDSGGFVHWHDGAGTNVFVTQNSSGVPGGPEANDRYGAAIYAATEAPNADGGHMLLVGAPGEDIGSVNAAGAVHLFRFDESVRLGDVKGFNQNSTGVGSTVEAGDRFGASLATFGTLDPLVGAPGEDIGSVRNAGLVGAVRGYRFWSQDTAGMPGAAEAGDRLGATIGNARVPFTGDGDDFWHAAPLIGAPGENSGGGSVTSGVSTNGSTQPGWTQQDAEAGDRYGASIGKAN